MKAIVVAASLLLLSLARVSSATVIDSLEMDDTLREVLRTSERDLFDTLRVGETSLFTAVQAALRAGDVAGARQALDRARAGQADHPGGLELEGALRLLEGDARGAVQALDRARELAPDAASVYPKLAAAKLALGDLAGAETDLARATELQPRDLLARILLARLSLARGDTNTTIEHVRAGIAGTSAFTVLHSELAELLLVRQRPEEVIELVAPFRDNGEAILIHARALLATGDLRAAEQMFAAARTRGADAKVVEVFLANIARLNGNVAEAERTLRRLNDELPNRPAVMESLATTLAAADKVQESQQFARAAAGLLPPPHPGRLNLARLALATGAPDLALEITTPMLVTPVVDSGVLAIYAQSALGADRSALAADAASRLVRDYPDDSMGYLLGTAAAERLGRAEEARSVAAAGTGRLPQDIQVWTNRVDLLLRQERAAEALQVARQAIERNPRSLPLQFVEANVQQVAGSSSEAERIYRRLAGEEATRLASLNNLANLLSTQPARRQEALTIAQQAASIAPAVPDVQDTLGWILHLNGRSAEAAGYLREAARQAPANAGIVCHYGLVRAAVEGASAARPSLEQCLRLNPDAPLAQQVNALL